MGKLGKNIRSSGVLITFVRWQGGRLSRKQNLHIDIKKNVF